MDKPRIQAEIQAEIRAEIRAASQGTTEGSPSGISRLFQVVNGRSQLILGLSSCLAIGYLHSVHANIGGFYRNSLLLAKSAGHEPPNGNFGSKAPK
jgi:hypothetical protein